MRFEEQAVDSMEVLARRYEVIVSWMGNDFQLTFHPVPYRPITGMPQATMSLDGTVSSFRGLIVDETEHGPTLGDVEARIHELGEDVQLGWLAAALDAQIERAVDMTAGWPRAKLSGWPGCTGSPWLRPRPGGRSQACGGSCSAGRPTGTGPGATCWPPREPTQPTKARRPEGS